MRATRIGGTMARLMPAQPEVLDARSRPLHDLRISVTDRCNFRCVYCMPREVFGRDWQYLPREEILTYEEISRLAGIFTALGVHKVRLTGGEPLVRRDLDALVRMLAANPAITDLTLTTNGSLLAAHATALATAGLTRVTVSLDATDDPTFERMNDAHVPVARVLEGIEAAEAAGLGPVKVNMVVKRGWNEHAVLPMARRFRGTGRVIRFIEYMDVGHSNGWRLDEVVPGSEILATIAAEFPLEPMAPTRRGEVARRYRYADGGGEIGLIASVSQPFCGDCVRARLSADGKLFTCLFAVVGHDLKRLVRDGSSDDEIESRLRRLWAVRDDNYSERRSAQTAGLPKVEMSYIGG
jgi:GTP 3',8-cyclase